MDTLARIEAERACERLIMRYALAVNAWDIDAFVGLFTPQATWQRPANPPLEGREQIRMFMEGQPTERTVRHVNRSEEHTSELQSLMRISYAAFCLKK